MPCILIFDVFDIEPVMTTSRLRGMSSVTFRKLCIGLFQCASVAFFRYFRVTNVAPLPFGMAPLIHATKTQLGIYHNSTEKATSSTMHGYLPQSPQNEKLHRYEKQTAEV